MNEFRKADAQLRAAIDLMESTGVLGAIKEQAIEEAISSVINPPQKDGSMSVHKTPYNDHYLVQKFIKELREYAINNAI